jgi:hypothetical protein
MIRNEKKAKRNGRLLAGSVFGLAGAALLSLYLVNKQPNIHYEAAKENVQIQEVVSRPAKSAALAQNEPASSLENKVLSSDKKVEVQKKVAETKKIQTPAAPNIHYNAGIVMCSNKNYLYAQLNLEVLKGMGHTNAFMQEIKVAGDTYYRTIIGATSQNLDAKMKELKAKDLFGMADQYFRVWGEDLSKFSKETPTETTKRVQKMENDFTKRVDKFTKNEFTNFMTPFIDKSYSLYNKGEKLPVSKINEISGYIYNAAQEFKIPLVQYTALIAHESKFTNIKGDLKYKYNYSEGYIQMRRETQKFVFKKMKEGKIQGLPDELPASLLPHPQLQLRMGACYYAYCLKMAGWDGESVVISSNLISKATSKYNLGHGSKKINQSYEKKVQEEKKMIIGYLPSAL